MRACEKEICDELSRRLPHVTSCTNEALVEAASELVIVMCCVKQLGGLLHARTQQRLGVLQMPSVLKHDACCRGRARATSHNEVTLFMATTVLPLPRARAAACDPPTSISPQR